MYETNDLKEALIKQEELYFTLQEKLRYNIFIPDSIEGLVKRDHHTDGPLKALALALESAKKLDPQLSYLVRNFETDSDIMSLLAVLPYVIEEEELWYPKEMLGLVSKISDALDDYMAFTPLEKASIKMDIFLSKMNYKLERVTSSY